jgi:hypothetical protein
MYAIVTEIIDRILIEFSRSEGCIALRTYLIPIFRDEINFLS